MQKRETINHNDKYVVFYDFEDEQDDLDAVEEPLTDRQQTREA